MQEKIKQIQSTLPTYIQSWSKIPSDIDVNNIQINGIRKVEGFKTETDIAWIITFSTESNFYSELLLDEELSYNVGAFKDMLERENNSFGLLARDVICRQSYYEYPLVYGEE